MFPPHCVEGSGEDEVVPELPCVRGAGHGACASARSPASTARIWRTCSRGSAPQLVEVMGVCTDICVLHTVAGLRARGYEVLVRKDLVETYDSPGTRRGGVQPLRARPRPRRAGRACGVTSGSLRPARLRWLVRLRRAGLLVLEQVDEALRAPARGGRGSMRAAVCPLRLGVGDAPGGEVDDGQRVVGLLVIGVGVDAPRAERSPLAWSRPSPATPAPGRPAPWRCPAPVPSARSTPAPPAADAGS